MLFAPRKNIAARACYDPRGFNSRRTQAAGFFAAFVVFLDGESLFSIALLIAAAAAPTTTPSAAAPAIFSLVVTLLSWSAAAAVRSLILFFAVSDVIISVPFKFTLVELNSASGC